MGNIMISDALSGLKTLPSESVDMCVTSPPYYNLRDYGAPGQIGLEKTPEEYISRLVEIFHEVKRVLKPCGTLWIVILCCRIVCGDCGTFYGSKVWHSTDKYRRVVWQCNAKFKQKCKTPKFDESTIKEGFVTALNQLIGDKDNILDDCRMIQKALTDCSEIDRRLNAALQEIEVITELTKKCINENSTNAQNQADFAAKYNSLVERYEAEKSKADDLHCRKLERQRKADEIGAFMFRIHELDAIEEFDSAVWLSTIDKVITNADGSLLYCFINGAQIKV